MATNKKSSIGIDKAGQIFCKKCGKAGFKTKSHAWGHTGVCEGLKVKSTSPSPSPSPYPAWIGESFREQVLSGAAAMVGCGEVSIDSVENRLRVLSSQLEERIDALEQVTGNHFQHLGSMIPNENFFESTLFKVILVGIAIVAVLYLIENGDSKTKQKVSGDLLGFAMKRI
jgi:hypothetical protein